MNAMPENAPMSVPGSPRGIRLSRRAIGLCPYAPPVGGASIDLHLDANEGPPGVIPASASPSIPAELARRYPNAAALEQALADRLRVGADSVLVTAGGDDAIDRACRVSLEPGRRAVVPVPTFEMIERYAASAGGETVRVSWRSGRYPVATVIGAADERTGLVAVVSPNNPTGAVVSGSDLRMLAGSVPDAMVLVDLAYTEFADEDLTPEALSLPNALVVRTFSKAFGLAGLRVGYAVGPAAVIRAMRGAGSPFPTSAVSLLAAACALERADEWLPAVVSRVRMERDALASTLRSLGAPAWPSQANFVLAEFGDAGAVWNGLAEHGIAVRRFAPGSGLDRCLRISCPASEPAFERLTAALRTVLREVARRGGLSGEANKGEAP